MTAFEVAGINRYSAGRPSRLAVWCPDDLVERLLANEADTYVIVDAPDAGKLPDPESVTYVLGL